MRGKAVLMGFPSYCATAFFVPADVGEKFLIDAEKFLRSEAHASGIEVRAVPTGDGSVGIVVEGSEAIRENVAWAAGFLAAWEIIERRE